MAVLEVRDSGATFRFRGRGRAKLHPQFLHQDASAVSDYPGPPHRTPSDLDNMKCHDRALPILVDDDTIASITHGSYSHRIGASRSQRMAYARATLFSSSYAMRTSRYEPKSASERPTESGALGASA